MYLNCSSHDNENNDDFLIDYVKVWQNENFESSIKSDDYYQGNIDLK